MDIGAILWLIVALVAMVILIYGPLFWLFFGFCRLDGPMAIRWAWTVGVGWLVIVLAVFGEPYEALQFWNGQTFQPLSLALALPALALLAIIWATKPRLQG